MTTAEQILRIRAGDDHLFADLVERYSAQVWALCSSYVADRTECEDIVQEVFVRSYRHLADLRKPEAFPAWLCRIARSQCLLHLRTVSRRRAALTKFAHHAEGKSNGMAPDDGVRQEELREAVRAKIDALTPKLREALNVYYVEGRSSTEAAAFLGITPAAMRKRLETARKTLKDQLWEEAEQVLALKAPDKELSARVVAAVPFGTALWLGELGSGAVAGTKLAMAGGGAVMAKKITVGLAVVLALIAGYAITAREGSGGEESVPGEPAAAAVVSGASADMPEAPPDTKLADEEDGEEDPAEIREEEDDSEPDGEPVEQKVDPGAPGTISGFVYAADGSPSDGAIVAVQPQIPWRKGMSSTPSLRATTDERGVFVVGGLKETPFGYTAAAFKHASGFGYAKDIRIEATDVVIRLAPGGEVRGRVFDMVSGEGVEGVRVAGDAIEDASMASIMRIFSELAARPSDEEGRYILPLPAPAAYTIGVPKAGSYMPPPDYPEEVRLDPGEHRDGIDFALARGGSISGTVFDPAGEPLAAIQVNLASLTGAGFENTTSGEDGAYIFPGLPPEGSYVVTAHHDEFRSTASEILEMAVLADIVCDLHFGQGHTVYGRVVDTDGEGVEGLNVSLVASYSTGPSSSIGMGYGGTCLSDEAGEFAFENVQAGKYGASVVDEAYQILEYPRLEMPPDSDYHDLIVRVRAKQEGFMAGRVLDDDGQPLANVRLIVSCHRPLVVGYGSSGADGAFLVEGIGGAERFEVRASLDGYANARLPQVSVNSDGVEIVMSRLGRIRGTVLAAVSGKPITRFEARVATYMRGGREVGNPHGAWQEFQSPTGEFMLTGVRPPAVRVEVRAEGLSLWQSDLINVPSGSTVENVVARLAAAGSVAGTVIDAATGAPAPGIRVQVVPEDIRSMEHHPADVLNPGAEGIFTLSDEGGRYRLDSLTPGDILDLAAWGEGYAVQIVPGVRVQTSISSDIDIVLSPEGILEGSVYEGDTPGEQYAYSVTLRPAGRGASLAYSPIVSTLANGLFRIDKLPPGFYNVTVVGVRAGAGAQLWSGTAEIAAGQITELDIHIQNATVTGQVLGAPDGAVISVRITVTGQPGRVLAQTECGADGRFELPVFFAGACDVIAEIGDDIASQPVTLSQGEAVEVTLEF